MQKHSTYFVVCLLLASVLSRPVFSEPADTDAENTKSSDQTTIVIQATESPSEDPFVEGMETYPDGEKSSETASSGDVPPQVEDEVEEPGKVERLIDWIWSWGSEVKAGAEHSIEALRLERSYGIDSDDTTSQIVLLEAEAALKRAEVLRAEQERKMREDMHKAAVLKQESIMCLALNGYYEARNQTADQEFAVGAVVLNRLSVGFLGATTVCEVIHTPHQFSWVKTHGLDVPKFDNKIERKAWERSLLIAKRLMTKDPAYVDPSNGATHYHADYVNPRWAKSMDKVATLGTHIFYVEPKGNSRYIDNTVNRINPAILDGLPHDQRERVKSEFNQSVNAGE